MTREEAIRELKLIAKVTMWNDRREAVEMAIEALSVDAERGGDAKMTGTQPYMQQSRHDDGRM